MINATVDEEKAVVKQEEKHGKRRPAKFFLKMCVKHSETGCFAMNYARILYGLHECG